MSLFLFICHSVSFYVSMFLFICISVSFSVYFYSSASLQDFLSLPVGRTNYQYLWRALRPLLHLLSDPEPMPDLEPGADQKRTGAATLDVKAEKGGAVAGTKNKLKVNSEYKFTINTFKAEMPNYGYAAFPSNLVEFSNILSFRSAGVGCLTEIILNYTLLVSFSEG